MTHEKGKTGPVGSTAGSAISPERYALIKPIPKEGGFFQNFPGVYCKQCGKDFALYCYSGHQPDGIDENGKPFYDGCLMCSQKANDKVFPRVLPNDQGQTRSAANLKKE